MKRSALLVRTPIKRAAPKPPAKRERVAAPARPIRTPATGARAAPIQPQPKTPDRVNNAIRRSAQGEPCLVRLPRCTGEAVWSHNKHARAGKGRGIKSLDLNGCYACPSCDAIYDGNAPRPQGVSHEWVELAWYHAHAESLVRLSQKGLI